MYVVRTDIISLDLCFYLLSVDNISPPEIVKIYHTDHKVWVHRCSNTDSYYSVVMIIKVGIVIIGLSWWLTGKESACQSWRHSFDPWFVKIPLEKETGNPLQDSGKSHEQRSLAGYSPWGRKRVRHSVVTKNNNSWDY